MVERAAHVRLGSAQSAVRELRHRPVPDWDIRRHYTGERDRTTRYVLVLDTVNFCFWPSPGGYWRLAEGLRDAFAAGDDLARAENLASLAPAELARWTGQLPLMDERVAALRELGSLAVRELGGDVARLVEKSAAATAGGLAGRLASFHDVALYQGREIPILKRAQIAAADVAGAGLAGFADLAALTCFADYKLPQLLRHLGVLEYHSELAERVDGGQELTAGEAAEVEIRAATVAAVEQIRQQLAEAGRSLHAFQLDWMLWSISQELAGMKPHHRVRTGFY